MPHIQADLPARAPRRLAALPLVAALLALPALGACTISQDEEVEIGRENATKIEQQLPMVQDAAAAAYLDSLGQSMARTADTRGLKWQFRLVDSEEVNAFALPGGFVYVNRGLVDKAETLSELAGVLGHEIGHVTMRHSARQLEKAQKTGVGVTLLCALTSVCDNSIGRVAVQASGSAIMAKFSRADELQADSVAVGYVSSVGIDPDGIPMMFRRLMEERERRPDIVDGFFGTHPVEEDRVRQAQALIRQLEPELPKDLRLDDELYQQFRARLAALPPSPKLAPPGESR
jgi:predicted Zn-dependent protease